MKRLLIIGCLIGLFLIVVSAPAMATEKATKEECEAKCREAAKLIKEVGLEAASAKMNDKSGPFVWKDSFVFCFGDEKAKMYAHAYLPKDVLGRELINMRDPNGVQTFAELIKKAKKDGEGWIDYQARNPATKQIADKTSFILWVPEAKVVIGAGFFK